MTLHEMMEDAYRRGFEVGRRAELPFAGLPRLSGLTEGAEFVFRRGWVTSYEDYERRVTDELRAVWRGRWDAARRERGAVAGLREAIAAREEAERVLRAAPRHRHLVARVRRPWELEVRWAASALEQARREQELLARFEPRVRKELRLVREALDAELATGRGRPCVAEAMRREPLPPPGVRCYATVEEFVAEDERRRLGWSDVVDAGGADYGFRWSLENPMRRWETTRWRISFLHGIGAGSTDEVYAVELSEEGRRRVWLLGTLPDSAAMADAIGELELHGQRERNSLVAAADRVVRAARRA